MKRMKRLTSITTFLIVGVLGATLGYKYVDNENPEEISPSRCLRRLSLDLRDQGPSAADIAAIRAGEKELGDFANEYMDSSEFGDVVFRWFREKFPKTRISPDGVDLGEPARIAKYIVVQDRDFRELLTADYTVDNNGSQQSVTDRPAAGVLSTAHYMSAYVGSLRRNWAGHFVKEWSGVRLAAISVPPDTDEAELSRDAIAANPACRGCHAQPPYGIDHLGVVADCFDMNGVYDGECSAAGEFLNQPVTSMPELGQVTANSNEFLVSTVQFFSSKLMGRNLAKEEVELYDRVVRDFVKNNYSAKELIRSMVTSKEYCSL